MRVLAIIMLVGDATEVEHLLAAVIERDGHRTFLGFDRRDGRHGAVAAPGGIVCCE